MAAPSGAANIEQVWETRDPEGLRVLLTQRAWAHIVERHKELLDLRAVVHETVARPDIQRSGRVPGEVWYFARGVGPSRWFHVVVHFDQAEGTIATAFGRRVLPSA